MKEALDHRDTGQRDAAFYAARALESTIKIISDKISGRMEERKVPIVTWTILEV